MREAIERGNILVGVGASSPRSIPKGCKLRGGETVLVKELLEAVDNLVAPVAGSLRVAFEDAALLAFDKPAGMPVQPLTCRETGTLMNAVVARYPECRPLGDSPLMAGALHRIDADTSGLVLVARTAAAFDALRAQFSAQTVKKTYPAPARRAESAKPSTSKASTHSFQLRFTQSELMLAGSIIAVSAVAR